MSQKPKTLTMIVDEIGEDVVRVELDGQAVHLPRACVPEGTREGDRLVADLTRDDNAQARRTAAEAAERLHQGDDGGDVEL